jgi:hypothetical protein
LSRTQTRRWLILASIALSLGVLLGLPIAFGSLFLFDAPGSENNPAVWVLFWSALTFPLACLVSLGVGWVLYALKWFTSCCCISLLPAVNVICVGAAMFWLSAFNHGTLGH